MVCRNCGTEIAANALICYKCGTATSEPKITPPVNMRRRSLVRPAAAKAIALLLLAVALAVAARMTACGSLL